MQRISRNNLRETLFRGFLDTDPILILEMETKRETGGIKSRSTKRAHRI